jgi:hypothetical protein
MAPPKTTNQLTLNDWRNVKLVDEPVIHDDSTVEGATEQRRLNMKVELEMAMALCEPDGLYLEFGVFKGWTINKCAEILPNQHFWGFDSFEGLPEEWIVVDPKDPRVKKWKKMNKGHFAVDQLPEVSYNVTLVKGFFDQSLELWMKENIKPDSKISWLHLDADLYSSTIYVLEKLNDYIVPGTIIRFDELVDWRLEQFPCSGHKRPKPKYSNWREGEWKAMNEWLEKYDRQIQPLWRDWHQCAGVKVIK